MFESFQLHVCKQLNHLLTHPDVQDMNGWTSNWFTAVTEQGWMNLKKQSWPVYSSDSVLNSFSWTMWRKFFILISSSAAAEVGITSSAQDLEIFELLIFWKLPSRPFHSLNDMMEMDRVMVHSTSTGWSSLCRPKWMESLWAASVALSNLFLMAVNIPLTSPLKALLPGETSVFTETKVVGMIRSKTRRVNFIW